MAIFANIRVMNTVTFNISLPQTLANQVDAQIASGEFASRSEFFRTLLRLYGTITQTVTKHKADPIEFVEYKKVPLKQVEEEFMATGKYSKKFVKGIVEGLRRSSVYANS